MSYPKEIESEIDAMPGVVERRDRLASRLFRRGRRPPLVCSLPLAPGVPIERPS